MGMSCRQQSHLQVVPADFEELPQLPWSMGLLAEQTGNRVMQAIDGIKF
jgi:hypothetical protein